MNSLILRSHSSMSHSPQELEYIVLGQGSLPNTVVGSRTSTLPKKALAAKFG